MKIHIYDFLNKNKLAQLDISEFSKVSIGHTIDDFSTAVIYYNSESKFNGIETSGFENVYIEDDDGNIIFGGILTGYNITSSGASISLSDHRWILTRLILDESITLSAGQNILDVVEELLNVAQSKRSIPIEFDRDGSAYNSDYVADLKFEIGDDIGGSLQKIIQSTYSRWAVRYYKSGNEIYGKLIVRSVIGVTPEGVGIARGSYTSEDGTIIRMLYSEGDPQSNIQTYKVVQDLSRMSTRTKLGSKTGGVPAYYDSNKHLTDLYVYRLEYFFGRTEEFVSDNKVNSEETGQALANLSQTMPRADVEVVLDPTWDIHLNCGDRVDLTIKSKLITGIEDRQVRIDSVTYEIKSGYIEKRILLNFMSPQKRTGTTGLLQAIGNIEQRLDGLDKDYLNS